MKYAKFLFAGALLLAGGLTLSTATAKTPVDAAASCCAPDAACCVVPSGCCK